MPVAEPSKKAGEDQIELIGSKRPQLSNCSYVRISRYTLCQECASLQERDVDGDLVFGTAEAGGMWEDGDQGAVCIAVGHTDHKGGANLPLHPKIKKPHFTAARRHLPRLSGRQRADQQPRPSPRRPTDQNRTAPPGGGIPP